MTPRRVKQIVALVVILAVVAGIVISQSSHTTGTPNMACVNREESRLTHQALRGTGSVLGGKTPQEKAAEITLNCQ